ncbi:hypothetical protein BDV40DRAFT_98324 [Aspergillus tamarii]|uniref:Uncharacterized protein n=1 Tax=Aspergillus tamarii TaxID=41984 RepID=A0A5N6VBI3_ASPTM|nr:hypothetical protein BDV40DRAFT_98324 [Aspergillus tamarii]
MPVNVPTAPLKSQYQCYFSIVCPNNLRIYCSTGNLLTGKVVGYAYSIIQSISLIMIWYHDVNYTSRRDFHIWIDNIPFTQAYLLLASQL